MDSLYLRTGIGPSISVSSNLDPRSNSSQFSAGRPPAAENGGGGGYMRTALSRFSFKHPFRSLFHGAKPGVAIKGVALDDAVSTESRSTKQGNGAGNLEQSEGQNGNWVLKFLHVKFLWSEQGNGLVEEEIQKGEYECSSSSSPSESASFSCGEHETCDCKYDDEEEEENENEKDQEIVFDKSSFSKLLKKVPLADAKLYAEMSSLGSLAYDIPKIKPRNLLRRHGLVYVTSSIEKREQLAIGDSEQLQQSTKVEEMNEGAPSISASAAFDTVASAAAYLKARTRSILGSSEVADLEQEMLRDVDASLMTATDSVTAVVAAKEEVKQAVADDLNSISSSPCEWYICDDHQTATRFFVIQGSETLASWQANLLFEPIEFEGFGIMVHRGIYEAAKGIYEQMLPEIRGHTEAYGARAKLRFTGHSLGGSLSVLINLMLLLREEALPSALLPVITFGAPTVMCGGDALLRQLGLPTSHVQAITMHRDIVPRAFSCYYPNHVATILKALNANFRTHTCLNELKLLFTPMGELIILQPDSNYSPQHQLLPSGSGLYLLRSSGATSPRLLRSAKLAFLNSPHPLQILINRSAYGNAGTIQLHHDMTSYLHCIRFVIRHGLAQLRRQRRDKRRHLWRAPLRPRGAVARKGGESLSRHLHLLVLLLFPIRWLVIEC